MALGNLYANRAAQNVPHALCEGLAHIAAVTQQGLHFAQVIAFQGRHVCALHSLCVYDQEGLHVLRL